MNVGRGGASLLACLAAPSHQVMLNPCQNYRCKTLSFSWKEVKAWLMRKLDGEKIQIVEFFSLYCRPHRLILHSHCFLQTYLTCKGEDKSFSHCKTSSKKLLI